VIRYNVILLGEFIMFLEQEELQKLMKWSLFRQLVGKYLMESFEIFEGQNGRGKNFFSREVTRYCDSERTCHKMPDIRFNQQKIEVNTEVQVLTIVWRKESWSRPEFSKDSMSLTLRELSEFTNSNETWISRDSRINLTVYEIFTTMR
jgi:hypothetical protein